MNRTAKLDKSLKQYATISAKASLLGLEPLYSYLSAVWQMTQKGREYMSCAVDTFDLETAILNLGEIELFLDMYRETLIDKPWTRLDKKRLEKMEYAFYMLMEQCAAKKQAIEAAFYGAYGDKAEGAM